ncbi:MAG TPA: protein phosphatase 2C domain-containing protein [Micromonosporaceae bacterium]|nr:protein phosphatase 2C domain-containing protein [Micromonosporaceae bacterium]
MSLTLRAVAVTDVGLRRENNEDSVYAGRRLIAVADGVGGMPAGDVASAIMIRELAELEHTVDGSKAPKLLRRAADAANRAIHEAAAADPARQGMGTTVTAVLLFGADRLALLHVGDSRGYLLRGDDLIRLTKDDTYVQSLVDQGVLTADEARSHPQRSLVTQAVAGGPLSPAEDVLDAEPADRILLCSDGLSDIVTDESIAHALRSYPDPRDCAERLVKLALQAGAPDNVTVVIADLVELPR